jgi:hypothetical protein
LKTNTIKTDTFSNLKNHWQSLDFTVQEFGQCNCATEIVSRAYGNLANFQAISLQIMKMNMVFAHLLGRFSNDIADIKFTVAPKPFSISILVL